MYVARATLAAAVLAAALPSLAADPPRDPFTPYGVAEDDVLRSWPFATVDVAALKLEGVVVGVASPTAIVVGPDGRGVMIKVGTLIGREGAQVKAIRRDRIVLETTLRNSIGEVRRVSSAMMLPGR